MGAARSVPPAASSGPGLRKARLEERDGLRDWFAAWCVRHHVSVRDLASILDVSATVAHAKLTGAKPVTLNDLYRFPPRFRNELVLEFATWCAGNSNASHS